MFCPGRLANGLERPINASQLAAGLVREEPESRHGAHRKPSLEQSLDAARAFPHALEHRGFSSTGNDAEKN